MGEAPFKRAVPAAVCTTNHQPPKPPTKQVYGNFHNPSASAAAAPAAPATAAAAVDNSAAATPVESFELVDTYEGVYACVCMYI